MSAADRSQPRYGANVFVASTAYVGGDVTLDDDVSVMHHVTIRGDVSAIRIGPRCNVQDGSVLHTKTGVDMEIGAEVGIGHRAVVHCRRVGAGSLIGIGAIVLDDAEIGADCLIAAGALVTPGTKIPDGKVVLGMPARVARDLTEKDREYMRFVVQRYLNLGRRHAAGEFPNMHPAL